MSEAQKPKTEPQVPGSPAGQGAPSVAAPISSYEAARPAGAWCYKGFWLRDGSLGIAIELPERFSSEPEAKKAADELINDYENLQNFRKLQWEVTHSTTLAGETSDQTMEAVLRDQCDWIAAKLGMTGLWKESQTWPHFQKAWKAWLPAWKKWEKRKFPETRGPAHTRYLWQIGQFLAALRTGLGDKPEFYRNYAWLLWCAARLGDVKFFTRFAKAKHRKKKIDPRSVQHWLIVAWMPAALWSCSRMAIAKVLSKKIRAWGNQGKPETKLESVRRSWRLLGLWHDENCRIADFKRNWRPVWHPNFRR
jgi:hypothetical protein